MGSVVRTTYPIFIDIDIDDCFLHARTRAIMGPTGPKIGEMDWAQTPSIIFSPSG